jgi:signal transduction histidine kinase
MRAKRSSTARGIYSRSGTLTALTPVRDAVAAVSFPADMGNTASRRNGRHGQRNVVALQADKEHVGARTSEIAEGTGLLHDAQNLLSAIGLYCDLLMLPDVLKPQHRHYADELRLLGRRSETLMHRMMLSLLPPQTDQVCADPGTAEHHPPVQPISLREIVERSMGFLRQVAGGRTIEVVYGPAALVPVLVSEETVERILVNLVRNSAASLDQLGETQAPAPIRVEAGLVSGRTGDPKPWPFRRVTLAVQDSGCGMSAAQVQQLLGSVTEQPRNPHGMGFRVVHELVTKAGGDLRIRSKPGSGTRVQIEWPISTACLTGDKPETTQSQRSAAADDRRIAC